MDGAANWRPTQGADPAAVAAAGGVDPNAAAAAAGGDWRNQLQPEARSRIVNKMCVHSLFLPFPSPPPSLTGSNLSCSPFSMGSCYDSIDPSTTSPLF
jgi:hypothetical protein